MAVTKRGPVTAITPEGKDLGLCAMFEVLGSKICEHANAGTKPEAQPTRQPDQHPFNR